MVVGATQHRHQILRALEKDRDQYLRKSANVPSKYEPERTSSSAGEYYSSVLEREIAQERWETTHDRSVWCCRRVVISTYTLNGSTGDNQYSTVTKRRCKSVSESFIDVFAEQAQG